MVKKYSQSSRKPPPWKFEKVVVTRAGHLRELALVSDRMAKKKKGWSLTNALESH